VVTNREFKGIIKDKTVLTLAANLQAMNTIPKLTIMNQLCVLFEDIRLL
jgi:hypothetical protein